MRLQQSTLSQKNQTVVPLLIRKKLGLRAGDQIIWNVVAKGTSSKAIAEPMPKDWAAYMKGLGEEMWSTIDIDEYIDQLREEWNNEH